MASAPRYRLSGSSRRSTTPCGETLVILCIEENEESGNSDSDYDASGTLRRMLNRLGEPRLPRASESSLEAESESATHISDRSLSADPAPISTPTGERGPAHPRSPAAEQRVPFNQASQPRYSIDQIVSTVGGYPIRPRDTTFTVMTLSEEAVFWENYSRDCGISMSDRALWIPFGARERIRRAIQRFGSRPSAEIQEQIEADFREGHLYDLDVVRSLNEECIQLASQLRQRLNMIQSQLRDEQGNAPVGSE